MSISRAALAVFGASLLAAPAFAQDRGPDWSVQVGPARVSLVDKATIRAGGAVLPGAGIDTEAQLTGVVEIGRYVSPAVALSLTLGGPPLVEIDGAGTLAPLGRLANVRYGPSGLTAQYHPNRDGRFDPYVGAGFTYMHIFSTEDRALSNVKVEDDIGPLVQAGARYWLGERWGLFADVKKGWLKTKATGTLGGAPIDATVKMDPFVLTAGVAVRF